MTRKDYVILAAALRDSAPRGHSPEDRIARDAWLATVRAVTATLAADNPRFDSSRFTLAVGIAS